MKEKILNVLRYIFCIPVAFLCAIIISAIVSIVQNLISSVCCSVMILRPFFVDCSKDFNQRTFLSDVVFYVVFIYLSGVFAPKYKKQIAIAVFILCLIVQFFAFYLMIKR